MRSLLAGFVPHRAQKDFGYEVFVKRFVDKGWAAMLLDYRGFGDSDCYPRALLID